MASSSSNVVGVHYRVGKKIGEGSFGVIFEGTNLLNNQQVAIKFVRSRTHPHSLAELLFLGEQWHRAIDTGLHRYRNLGRAMHHNYETNIEHTRFLLAAVSLASSQARSLTDIEQLVFLMSTTLARKAYIIYS
jgi:serine/threonine protein kinase